MAIKIVKQEQKAASIEIPFADLTCEDCGGTGFRRVPGKRGMPATMMCLCRIRLMKWGHIVKRCPAVATVPSDMVDGKALFEMCREANWPNLRITATPDKFWAVLRYIAVRMPDDKQQRAWDGSRETRESYDYLWKFAVATDADLLDAHLPNKGVKITGNEDVDDEERTRLRDIVIEPEVLIIVLGTQTTKNSDMPGVLLQALKMRPAGTTTWVVEQPDARFAKSHLAWSPAAEGLMNSWTSVSFE